MKPMTAMVGHGGARWLKQGHCRVLEHDFGGVFVDVISDAHGRVPCENGDS